MTFRVIKDPDAVLDYSVDWSSWLGADEIATSTWEITGTDSDLTVDTDSNTTTATTVWLSGGTLWCEYEVVNRITTTDGRTDDRTISVRIANK